MIVASSDLDRIEGIVDKKPYKPNSARTIYNILMVLP